MIKRVRYYFMKEAYNTNYTYGGAEIPWQQWATAFALLAIFILIACVSQS